jgi:GST-like protein
MDRRLANALYLGGAEYSIADIAAYPWIVPWKLQSQELGDFPSLKRWFESIERRAASVRAYAQADPYRSSPVVTEESRKVLFGQTAQTVR